MTVRPNIAGADAPTTVENADVTVVGGAGHVGVPLVLALAEAGLRVNVNDRNRETLGALEAGQPMLQELQRPRVLFGAAECSSCRMQMEEGSGKRALHPVQYLALAYGLMPDLARRLREPSRELLLA